MRYILYTDHYSPHELPLFRACSEVFDDAVYIVNNPWPEEASRKGWIPDLNGRKTVVLKEIDPAARERVFRELLSKDSVLMYGCYNNPYNHLIAESEGVVVYASERWLKPLGARIPFTNIRLKLSGMAHLLSPRFIRMMAGVAGRLRRDDRFFYFSLGVHAARDMARLCGLSAGDWRCLFRAPEPAFERHPGGRVSLAEEVFAKPDVARAPSPLQQGRGGLATPYTHGFATASEENARNAKMYCLDRMRMWGYFVEPSECDMPPAQKGGGMRRNEIKVLWVGRLLDLKRVDTIVRAVGGHANLKRADDSLPEITLDIYGEGPEEGRLRRIAERCDAPVRFHPFIPMKDVRMVMRQYDVYVLASNEYEGWGAVVSEAMEEGLRVLCSREAGAGATMLPEECLFDSGDADGLMKKLRNPPAPAAIGAWSAENAARSLLRFAHEQQTI